MHVEFGGTLTERSQKTHVCHEFTIPQNASRLAVKLAYPRGRAQGHMLCLSLLDPDGFRGSGHRGGALHEVALAAAEATAGYVAGPVGRGTWCAVIHAHRVIAGDPCPYRLEVEWDGRPQARAAGAGAAGEGAPRADLPRRARGPGWYRGDLHAHTVHSDGSWDVAALLARARELGLDFVSLTEHNTISQLAGIEGLSDDLLLVVGGMELTTFHGHALSLGTRRWIDWGVLQRDRPMSEVAADVRRDGGFFVIAHPTSEGDPGCTGCDWRYDDMMPGSAPAVEVWNGPWAGDSNNEDALKLWYRWLSEGHRLVATAGSDAHGSRGLSARTGLNVVWAEDRTEGAVIRAIARGHLYLSAGPRLHLAATSGGREATMGDTAAAETADLRVRWQGSPPGAVLRLIADGMARGDVAVGEEGTHRWSDLRARWSAVELRDRSGELLAVTNPVFFEKGPVGETQEVGREAPQGRRLRLGPGASAYDVARPNSHAAWIMAVKFSTGT